MKYSVIQYFENMIKTHEDRGESKFADRIRVRGASVRHDDAALPRCNKIHAVHSRTVPSNHPQIRRRVHHCRRDTLRTRHSTNHTVDVRSARGADRRNVGVRRHLYNRAPRLHKCRAPDWIHPWINAKHCPCGCAHRSRSKPLRRLRSNHSGQVGTVSNKKSSNQRYTKWQWAMP